MSMDQPTQPQAEPTRGGDGKFTRSIETARRDAQAAELRARGLTYRQIAAELQIDVSSAHEAVQRALRETVQEPAAEVRTLEADRLDQLWQAALAVLEKDHYQFGKDGEAYPDEEQKLKAVDRLLKIQARRAALLGLDMPTKVEQSGTLKYEVVGVDTEAL